MIAAINVLVAVRREQASRYHKNLSEHKNFRINIVTDRAEVLEALADREKHIEVLVIDNGLGNVYELIGDLRHAYPKLMIVLVDEEADFGMPGQADDLSTEPFDNNDLARRITRLMSDRQLETLRADSLPAVRDLAKLLRKASGEGGKQQAAVTACKDLGYDYVAFYRIESLDPLQVTLKAQDGARPIQAVAPKTASEEDLMGWVATTGESRIVGSQDNLNHPLVAKGRLGAAACVPVILSGSRYGVLVACREQPGSITQENALMLELVSNQLAAAILKGTIT